MKVGRVAGCLLLVAGMLGGATPVAEASRQLELEIRDITTTESGGSFRVAAQHIGDTTLSVGLYTLVMQFDDFDSIMDVTWMDLVPEMTQMGGEFGASPSPTQVTAGDRLLFGAFGNNGPVEFAPPSTELVQVDFELGPQWDSSRPFRVELLPNDPDDPLFSETVITDAMGVIPLALDEKSIGSVSRCDLNDDGACDALDIDALSAHIRQGGGDTAFDVNGDGIVSKEDRLTWVNETMNTYLGDSNLDGEFNSTDMVLVFRAGEYEDDVALNSSWSTGDWNGDAEFNSSDFVDAFVAAGYEQGPRAAAQAVPEPTSSVALLSAGILIWAAARRSEIRLMNAASGLE